MILSMNFECGFEYNGPVDRKTMNELAKRYFSNFIVQHKEMEWCDVIIYDEPRHDIGASRNPPPLPHNCHICETCRFSDESFRVGEVGLICYNSDKEWGGTRVLPQCRCDDWQFSDDYYFKEEE